MIESEPETIILPEPKVQLFNGSSGEILSSHVLPSEGFTCKYDPSGEYIMIGCYNGEKCLYSTAKDQIISIVDDPHEVPVSCLKWRPTHQSESKIVGICTSNGCFQYWHIPSLKKMFSIHEDQNQLFSCDFSLDRFVTAGKDACIRVYDEDTKSKVVEFGSAEVFSPGHSNRIFCVKFIDENNLVSGGWDSVIHFWDTRQRKSVGSFYGPRLSGDSIDLRDNQVLIGCDTTDNQIQIWDIRTHKQISFLNWTPNKEEVAYVHTCCFSPLDKKSIFAGACGTNEVKIFDASGKPLTSVRIFDLKHGVFSIHGSYSRKQFAFCTTKRGLYIGSYNCR